MGQRHQAFLIARISDGKGAGRYACLAAFHHQWCYGRLPLRATRRFLTLAKQPMNATIIREELKRIGESTVDDPETPSHYLSSLLGCAFDIGLDEKHPLLSGNWTLEYGFLPATMGCWDGDNNDGLSIIDITNPEHGAYCFLLDSSDFDPSTPLTAEDYARTYYAKQDIMRRWYLDEEQRRELEEDVVAVIDSLAEVPLIDGEALAEIWPRVFWQAARASSQEPEEGLETANDSASRVVPSLVDLILLPSIKSALARGNIEPIEHILWMPGKANAILDIFKSPEFDPVPDIALPLLAKALDQSLNNQELNISHLSLTDDQILFMIGEREDLRVLDVSHNANVTVTTVRTILSTVPRLKRLVLFGTNISKRDWNSLLALHPKLFYHIESIIHPCFYQSGEAFYSSSFAFVLQPPSKHEKPRTFTLPFFTPKLIVEALSRIFATQNFLEDTDYTQKNVITSPVGAVVLSHEVLGTDQPWGERAIPFFAPPLSYPPKEGWTFFMIEKRASKFEIGFVKREDSVIKTFDLTGFLLELEKEGRPEAPKHAVKTLTEAFFKLTNTSKFGSEFWYKWLTQERAEELYDNYETPDELLRRN